jgi:P-type Cu2+ transporter
MIQNPVWATAYNLVAIPVVGGLLVRSGLDLPMSVGAVAMSLSTIIVAANAQLLRRLKLQSTASASCDYDQQASATEAECSPTLTGAL